MLITKTLLLEVFHLVNFEMYYLLLNVQKLLVFFEIFFRVNILSWISFCSFLKLRTLSKILTNVFFQKFLFLLKSLFKSIHDLLTQLAGFSFSAWLTLNKSCSKYYGLIQNNPEIFHHLFHHYLFTILFKESSRNFNGDFSRLVFVFLSLGESNNFGSSAGLGVI